MYSKLSFSPYPSKALYRPPKTILDFGIAARAGEPARVALGISASIPCRTRARSRLGSFLDDGGHQVYRKWKQTVITEEPREQRPALGGRQDSS